MRANFFWFVNVLIALDFPEFERPAKAISMPSSGGQDLRFGAPNKKWAFCSNGAIECMGCSVIIQVNPIRMAASLTDLGIASTETSGILHAFLKWFLNSCEQIRYNPATLCIHLIHL